MIAVINIGVGNIKSVLMALKRVAPSEKVEVVSSREKLAEAHKIIFPGQGSMINCLSRIKKLGLLQPLQENLKDKPFFGICLGKQFLFDYSEEGKSKGLGLFSGEVKKFNKDKINNIKIPHMGWNKVNLKKKHHVFNGLCELSFKNISFFMINISNDDAVPLKYLWRNKYEHLSLSLWYDMTRKDGYFFDVGAHTGIYSIIGNLNKKQNNIINDLPIFFFIFFKNI